MTLNRSSSLGAGVRGLLLGLAIVMSLAQPSGAQIDAWIDPGHGGKDPGALGIDGPAAPNEKDLNLAVSLDVLSVLGSDGRLALLTRNSDIFWTKTRRTLIASGELPNDEGDQEIGTVCASVHMNSVTPDSTTFGTKVIFPAEKLFAKSRHAYASDSSFGGYVHSALLTNTPAAFLGCNHDLGLTKDVRELTVLRKSKIPTVIVECALISNRCQFNAMKTGGTQGLVANGIATGINNYLATLAPHRPSLAASVPAMMRAPYITSSPRIVGATSVLSAALQESFEGGTFPPPGWTLMSSGASQPYTWHRSTDSLFVAVGAGAAVVEGQSPGAIDEWLISPMFFVSTTDSTLHFRWLSNPFFASAANAHCAIRPKGSSTWMDAWTLMQEPQAVSFQYPDRVVSLSTWLGDSVQVAFRVNGASGPDLAIDDVSTGVFALTAPPSNNLTSAAIQLPAGSFLVSGSTCYAANTRDPFPADSTVSSCVPDDASGGDVFYKLTAIQDATARAELEGLFAQTKAAFAKIAEFTQFTGTLTALTTSRRFVACTASTRRRRSHTSLVSEYAATVRRSRPGSWRSGRRTISSSRRPVRSTRPSNRSRVRGRGRLRRRRNSYASRKMMLTSCLEPRQQPCRAHR